MADTTTICVIRASNSGVISNEFNRAVLSKEAPSYEEDSASHCSASFHGTPAPQNSAETVLRITTANRPQDLAAGFVFGKNPDVCDILLNDNAVSDRQFSLILNFASSTLLLKNLSRHGTPVKFHKLNETVTLKSTRWLDEFEFARLSLGAHLTLYIERYAHPVGWREFCLDLAHDVPGLGQLRLSTNIESSNASHRTPVFSARRRLGEGANARVFEAFERHSGNVYAMKLYNRNGGRWQEAEILERLRHEYIVDFVRYTKPAGRPAELVMELVAGVSLQRLLDPASGNPRLSLSEARDVVCQILQAVDYLHGRGYMHRDLKPANIMVRQRGPICIKVIDFGEAKKGTHFSYTCGTPLYTAPEISKRRWPCTNKVDLFSTGVIALQLFYGLPTQLGDRETWSDAMLRKRLSLLAAAAEDPLALAGNLIGKLLHEDPHRRSSAQRSLRHDFFRMDAASLDALFTADGDVADWPTQLYIPTVPPAEPQSQSTGEYSQGQAEIGYGEAGADMPDTESWGGPSHSYVQQGEQGELGEAQNEEEEPTQQASYLAESSSYSTPVFARSRAPTRSLELSAGEAESHHQDAGHASAEVAAETSASVPRASVPLAVDDAAAEHVQEYAAEAVYEDENAEAAYDEAANYEEYEDYTQEYGRLGPGPYRVEASQPAVRRRQRTLAEDKAVLEAWYLRNPRPDKADYERIIELVSMTKKQAQVWFQNRRHRDRQLARAGAATAVHS